MKTIRMFLLPLLVVFAVSELRAQSIADAARQERARQQGIHVTAVFTNDSLKQTDADKEKPATSKPATDAIKADQASTGLLDKNGKDEKYWREQFTDARQDLKRNQDAAAVLQLKLNQLNMELMRQDDMYNKENQLGPEITATKSQLDDAQKRVAASQQKLADMEDDLRKAGGPPGWARE